MLSTWTVDAYSTVVNFDIAAPSYSWYWQKQRNTSFYYKKRRPYWTIDSDLNRNYTWYDFTDIVDMNNYWCSEGECLRYIMAVNKWSGNMKILTYSCDGCEIHDLCWGDGVQINECDECFCPCQFTKFIKTDFVRWTRRLLQWDGMAAWVLGIQKNTNNWTVWTFQDSVYMINPETVKVWDWIYAHSIEQFAENPNPTGVYGQARQIISIDRDTDWNPIWILNAPWVGLDITTQEGTGVSYNVYPERGEVLMYVTCEWLKTIHAPHRYRDSETWEVIENFVADISVAATWFSWDICIYSVNQFNNRINILGNRWYNMYGWEQRDKMSFSVDNLDYVGADKMSQTVFRNFLVQFGKENINVIVYNADWISFSYKLDASIGIFSATSYATYQNSLYIIGSDKRLYSVEITSNGMNGYMLNLTDQSAQIKGDLELLQEWDEVNLSSDWLHIYIFINNKTSRYNSNNTKTRILKYDRTYNKRVRHDICCGTLTGKNGDWYLGDSLYTQSVASEDNLEYKDCNEFYIDAYIEAFIWENEDWQTEFSTLAYKKLRWMKVLLGKGIYTDGSTKFVIDYGSHWYKQQYQIDKVEHIEWIDKNNKIRQWIETSPSECALEVLAECTNLVRECSWQPLANEEIEKTGCKNRPQTYMDNCMCLDEKAYELADVYNVMLKLDHLHKSELFRVKIMSTGWDEMVFGWLVIWLETYDFSAHDTDNADVINDWSDCCVEGTYIDENNPCSSCN